MQGKAMDNLFEVCIHEEKAFCDPSITWKPKSIRGLLLGRNCVRLGFHDLTVGQVASASSAAAGGAAVEAWAQSLIELARQIAEDSLPGFSRLCSEAVKFLMQYVGPTMCTREAVYQEILKVLGCASQNHEKEDSERTVKRWSKFLRRMAIQMTVDSPLQQYHKGYMGIDAVGPTPHIRLHVHIRM